MSLERKTPQLRGAKRESVKFRRWTESDSKEIILSDSLQVKHFRLSLIRFNNEPGAERLRGVRTRRAMVAIHQALPEDMQLSKGPIPLWDNTVCSSLDSHLAPLPGHGFQSPLIKKLRFGLCGRSPLKKSKEVYKRVSK